MGRKNNYWIKLYESHFGDEINCEVRINNRIIPELTALLTEDVKKYAVTDWDQKQTVLLWQDKETRVEQPFTAAQVKEYAGQAIHLFAEKIEYDDIYDRILRMTGDESLSCELFFSAAGDFLSLLYSGHGDLQQEDPAVQSRKAGSSCCT